MKKRGKKKQPAVDGKKEVPKREKNRSFDEWVVAVLPRVLVSKKAAEDKYRSAVSCLLLAVIAFLLLAPFAGKAYHIDDPIFIWAAKHIQYAPADPYGFIINWYGREEPLWNVTMNPPLTSYYLTGIAIFAGWGEIPIHFSMFLWAIAAVIGTYYLACKLCVRPIEASLTALLTPVFLLSGTTVMCDMMMLSFWIWAIVFWIEGLDTDNRKYLVISSLLVAAAVLTKYYGIVLVPLLFVYSLAKKRRLGWWALYFIIPLVTLAGYQWVTSVLYGRGLFSDAVAYANIKRSDYHAILKGSLGLVFTGGCLLGTLFYAPFLWSRKYLLAGFVLLIVLAAVIFNEKAIGTYAVHDSGGIRWSLIIQFSIMFVAGLNILAVAASDLWRRSDADSLLLVLWVFGTFVFATFINWSINGRSILPMVPAVGILLMRRLEARDSLLPMKKLFLTSVLLIPASILALSVTWADYALARAGRDAATVITRKYSHQTRQIWFQGHWGFQYYMESLGAKPVDFGQWMQLPGDLMAYTTNSTNVREGNPEVFGMIETLEFQTVRWLSTMQKVMGASFHSDLLGCTPYQFGSVPPERYQIRLIKE